MSDSIIAGPIVANAWNSTQDIAAASFGGVAGAAMRVMVMLKLNGAVCLSRVAVIVRIELSLLCCYAFAWWLPSGVTQPIRVMYIGSYTSIERS